MPGQQKFPRSEHLIRKLDFQFVHQNGEKVVGAGFVCYFARRPGQGRKMGLAVSRKIGGAVVRNRVKRYIRETFRKHRSIFSDDVHVVIVARSVSARWDYARVESGLLSLWQKGALLHG